MVDLTNYIKNCEHCKQKLVRKSYEHPSHFIQRRFCNTSCSRLSRDMFTPEVRMKMSKALTGRIGIIRPDISERNKQLTEEKGLNWKGDKVGYRTLHKWVEKHLGKANHCTNNINHKSTRYHWSNISKEYKRRLDDFIQLCPSCNCRDRIGRRVSP